jgi:glycosyltransferase involved in cell wall biosynthesis
MTTNLPKVSVVIPCFNDEIYIEETIQSVLNQTFQDLEIIIVDDGSNAATKNVLLNFKNKKTQILTQSNQGLSAARNNGIKISKSQYILIIDSDDTFDKSFLEKAVTILDNDKSIAAVSSYCSIFIKNHQTIYNHQPKGGGIDNFLFDNNSVSFALIRKESWEFIGGYDEKMKNGFEDWEFWIRITKAGWTIFTIPEFLFNYRQKENSMLKSTKENFRETNLNYIFIKHEDLYKVHFRESITFLTLLAQRNKRNEIKFKSSIDFRIGKLFLFPFRFLKKTINILSKKNKV